MQKFDVLVIGGGPGGTPAAMALAAGGRRVLLVERGPGLGGTCLFEGCIPSKILHESARRFLAIRNASQFGVRLGNCEVGIDWQVIMARKNAIVQHRAQAAMAHAKKLETLTVQFGVASLHGARSARVTPAGGDAFDVEFDKAIVATGSQPNRLALHGSDLPRVITSDEVFDLRELPQTLVVIGGGPVGVEMAQIFAALGTKVSLLQGGQRILAPVDAEIALVLQDHMRRQGIAVEIGAKISRICHSGDGAFVRYRDSMERDQEVYGEYILEVVGRQANVEGLGLEKTAVRFDRHGIRVNDQLETDEPGLYAVGDVIGRPMFAHWASAQAQALAAKLLGKTTRFPAPAMNTAVIFSMPEIGIGGLTEDEARAAGYDVAVARHDLSTDARSQIIGQADGMLKLVYDRATRALLGVHLLADGAAASMGEVALALSAGTSVDALALSIHPHPTLSESFGVAAREHM